MVEQSSVRHQPAIARSTALVAVQHRTARDAAVRILRGLGATDVVGATTVDEARRAASGRACEIGIVEATLSDGSGTALARDLRNAGWRPTLVLATSNDPFSVRGALSAGVTCYLVVPGGTGQNGAAQPGIPSQRGTGLHQSTPPGSAGYGLSQREIDVLQLVADGRSNRDVGEQLGLSALTVKSHLARIARKLGTGDRAEMVIVALRDGLIS